MKHIAVAFFGLGAMAAAAAAPPPAQAQFVDATTIPGQAPGATGNVAGGGFVEMFGGGDDRTFVDSVGGGGGGFGGPVTPPGRFARMAGTDGDGPRVEYMAPPPRAVGREARLNGGGGDATITYLPGRRRR
jgi:hypothetical protein